MSDRNKLTEWLERFAKQFTGHTRGEMQRAAQQLKDDGEEMERLKKEKRRRVYYQDIVYAVCNVLDSLQPDGVRIVCGTIGEPSTQTQDGVENLMELYGLAVDGACGAVRERTALKQELEEANGRLAGQAICDFFVRSQPDNYAVLEGVCRVCGCTDSTPCTDPETHGPCYWIEPDLCSACLGEVT